MDNIVIDIGIPEIIITDKQTDDNNQSIVFVAESATRPICPNPDCSHKLTPNRHDKEPYRLHDVKAEGKLAYINLIMRRYKCPECQTVFPDNFTFFTRRQHMTKRLKNEFVTRCLKGETFRYIANDYSVDSKTVAAAFQEYVDEHREELGQIYTPEVLGIDEAHIDDHYRLVLTDIKGQKLLDMKSNNHPRTVKNYLKSLDKSVCKCVTMDFAPGYASAVRETLPNALIVIDKFHAVQEVNKCLDNLRKRVQREHLAKGEKIKRFKHSRKLFMTNWEDLTDDGESRLSTWFNEIPEFYQAYLCKEMFRDIYKTAETMDHASKMFDIWYNGIPAYPEFNAMRKTMKQRREHILNYWSYSWTNAYTESVNNAIKAIEKRGRGYKFDRLRELCMLEINKPKPEKFDPKKAHYTSVLPNAEERKKQLYIQGVGKKKPSFFDDANTNRFGFMVSFTDFPSRSWNINASIEVLFEIYNSLDRDKSFIERMTEYRNKLVQLNLIS